MVLDYLSAILYTVSYSNRNKNNKQIIEGLIHEEK